MLSNFLLFSGYTSLFLLIMSMIQFLLFSSLLFLSATLCPQWLVGQYTCLWFNTVNTERYRTFIHILDSIGFHFLIVCHFITLKNLGTSHIFFFSYIIIQKHVKSRNMIKLRKKYISKVGFIMVHYFQEVKKILERNYVFNSMHMEKC